jgi:hypothetical protein
MQNTMVIKGNEEAQKEKERDIWKPLIGMFHPCSWEYFAT